VTYSGSTKKLAEQGGFSRDDANVMILVSNHSLEPAPVAPTILKALGLDLKKLDGMCIEGTQELPGLPFGSSNNEDDQ
jgi:hypothetical protein